MEKNANFLINLCKAADIEISLWCWPREKRKCKSEAARQGERPRSPSNLRERTKVGTAERGSPTAEGPCTSKYSAHAAHRLISSSFPLCPARATLSRYAPCARATSYPAAGYTPNSPMRQTRGHPRQHTKVCALIDQVITLGCHLAGSKQ